MVTPRAQRIRPDERRELWPAGGILTNAPDPNGGDVSVTLDAGPSQVLSGSGGSSSSPIFTSSPEPTPPLAPEPTPPLAPEATPSPAPEGYVDVSVSVAGAQVTLNGEAVAGPPFRASVRPGTYRLEVAAPGHATRRATLVVAQGLVTMAEVDMVPISQAPRPTDLATRAPQPQAQPQQQAHGDGARGVGLGKQLLIAAVLVGAGVAAWKLGLSTED